MENTNNIKFRTYVNYIRVLGSFLEKEALSKIESLIKSDEYNKIQAKKNSKDISKLLRNVWFTEVKILLDSEDEDFIAVSNHWMCVKVYYCLYLTMRVFFLAKNRDIKEAHSSILKEISLEMKQGKLFPEPWSILCKNIERKNSDFDNLPADVEINHSESCLKKDQDFYNSFTRFLKTTRTRLIEKKYKELGKGKKKAKKQINSELYPTSIFDCLYRLRIRSNYEDADLFLLSESSDEDVFAFNKGMRNICYYTMFLLESLIAKHISRNEYAKIILEFEKMLSKKIVIQNNTILALKRWEKIQKLLK